MTETKAFDYTARTFETIREELRQLLLREIPDWVDSPSSFEGVLMDMWAMYGDVLHFYVDRLGSEAYLQTAVRRESLLNIAYMFGYVPTAQTAAKGTVTFTKVDGVGDITVLAGTQVYAQLEGFDPIVFETTEDRIITGASEDIDVVEGVTFEEELLGISGGQRSHVFALFNAGVIKDSVRVFTKDGNVDPSTGEPVLVEWTFTERIIDGEFFERAFSLFEDADGYTYVQFGDGVSGAIPATGVEVYATYRSGKGVEGNVAAGSIKSFVSGGDLSARIQTVTNAAPMQGGADSESIESMRVSIPKSIRAIERAVSLDDYAALAVRVGGVAKAAVDPASSVTSVQLAVAPVGGGAANQSLLDDTEAYLASRKMVGVDVTANPPVYVPVDVTVDVICDPRYRQNDVKESVESQVQSYFEFTNVEFGQRVTHGGIFRLTVDIEGLDYIEITTFNRDGGGDDPDFVLDYNEIPTMGDLIVNITGGITPT